MNTNLYKIAIFSVPRAGSSWLGQIFNSSPNVAYRFQPLFSYAFKDLLNENSTFDDIEKFHLDIFNTKDSFVLQHTNVSGKDNPKFNKKEITHLVWKEVRYLHIISNLLEKCDIKIISLVRNPLAVINSWLRSPKEFRRDLGWNEVKEWRYATLKNNSRKEEYNGFEKWKESTELFLNLKEKYPNNFYLVKYNVLLHKTLVEIKKIFNFCNLAVDEQTKNFIKNSKTQDDNDPYGVF